MLLPLPLVPEELLPEVPLEELDDGDRFLLLSLPSAGRLGGNGDLESLRCLDLINDTCFQQKPCLKPQLPTALTN